MIFYVVNRYLYLNQNATDIYTNVSGNTILAIFMYLEIKKLGSINVVLNKEFASIDSPLRVVEDENLLKPPMSWAIIEYENKVKYIALNTLPKKLNAVEVTNVQN